MTEAEEAASNSKRQGCLVILGVILVVAMIGAIGRECDDTAGSASTPMSPSTPGPVSRSTPTPATSVVDHNIVNGAINLVRNEHSYIEVWNCNKQDDGQAVQAACVAEGFQPLAELTQIVLVGAKAEAKSGGKPATLLHYVVFAYDKAIPELGLLVVCRYSDLSTIELDSTQYCDASPVTTDEAISVVGTAIASWGLEKP